MRSGLATRRLEAELMAIHHGNDWNAAARLVRDEAAKLMANPKCGRRRLLEGLDAFVEAIRTLGGSRQPDDRRLSGSHARSRHYRHVVSCVRGLPVVSEDSANRRGILQSRSTNHDLPQS